MNSKRIPLATAGLFVSWVTHDLEELATMSETSPTVAQQLPDWMPVALADRFGAEYEAYRRAVPAWRPRWHHGNLATLTVQAGNEI